MTTYTAILLVIFAAAFFILLPGQAYLGRLDWGYYPSAIAAIIAVALAFALFRATLRRRLP